MSKFNVGDKVKILDFRGSQRSPSWVQDMDKYVGGIYFVESVGSYAKINGWEWHDDWLELLSSTLCSSNDGWTTTTAGTGGYITVGSCCPVYPEESKKTNMHKLSTMMKKLLDSDTQVLVKAGFINGDLDLTELGRKNLTTILFLANKKELVSLAQEQIDEETKK